MDFYLNDNNIKYFVVLPMDILGKICFHINLSKANLAQKAYRNASTPL